MTLARRVTHLHAPKNRLTILVPPGGKASRVGTSKGCAKRYLAALRRNKSDLAFANTFDRDFAELEKVRGIGATIQAAAME